MKGCHHQHAAFLRKNAMLFHNPEIWVDKLGGGNPAKADNDFRLDKPELSIKPANAYFLLFRKRVAVLRRPAFDNVCNIDIFISVKVDRIKHFIEELAAAPDKWFSLKVFLLAGPFADEHDFSFWVACPDHYVCPCFVKAAFFAAQAGTLQFFQGLIQATAAFHFLI